MTGDLFAPAEAPPPKAPVRPTDPDTSHKAAAEIGPDLTTIRARVLRIAEEAGRDGFIDDDLVKASEGRPESSYRKRRTELTQEAWIIDSGKRRPNRAGNDEVVWVHRHFAMQPPPIQDRETAAARDKLLAEGRAMAANLSQWSRSTMKEGRVMFANGLDDAARIMRELSRTR